MLQAAAWEETSGQAALQHHIPLDPWPSCTSAPHSIGPMATLYFSVTSPFLHHGQRPFTNLSFSNTHYHSSTMERDPSLSIASAPHYNTELCPGCCTPCMEQPKVGCSGVSREMLIGDLLDVECDCFFVLFYNVFSFHLVNCVCTLSLPNIWNPQNSFSSLGPGLYKLSKAFHAGHMLTLMLPKIV
jgi:hypothetical protein